MTAIVDKAQFVRLGPIIMISGVFMKLGEKFQLDPYYKPAPLPFPLFFTLWGFFHHFIYLVKVYNSIVNYIINVQFGI